MDALHAKAEHDLARLFPNNQAPVPDGNESEPSSDVDDDFADAADYDTEAGLAAREAEHERAAQAAQAAGVPARRSSRSTAAASNAAIDAARERERAPLPV